MSNEHDHGEKCARCGEVGEDRRTLFMACFYEMSELKVPFERLVIHGQPLKQIGTEPDTLYGGDRTRPVFEAPVPNLPSEKNLFDKGPCNRDYRFFTLRVCKNCRGSWMNEIELWFNDANDQPVSTGTGVYIRHLGKNMELNERQVELLKNNPEALRAEL